MGGYPVGLDWTAVEALGRMTGTPMTPERLDDLQAMEQAAVEVFRERWERDHPST